MTDVIHKQKQAWNVNSF